MTEERVIRNRLALLPPIHRARFWRLYAEERGPDKTWRFLDLWMDDGRCILGAKGTGLGTRAKAAIDVGLTRPFPSAHEARLVKALLERYPSFAAVRLYRDEERALLAAEALAPGASIPVLYPFADFLRAPGVEAGSEAGRPRLAMPRLPCPAVFAPAVLLFREKADAAASTGDLVPPLLLACARDSLHELDRFGRVYDETLWRKADRRLGKFFERRGPYLFPKVDEEGYEAFFTAALGAGVLLSPARERPSIIPGDFDDGELAKLAAALSKLR